MPRNLTIFANFFIDSEERFLRFKDSLRSMSEIDAETYVVNVRGRYAPECMNHLRHSVSRCSVFSLESLAGWFYDSSKIRHLIATPYVLIWLEDHICMAPTAINRVVNEMESCGADILTHTFWCNGLSLNRYSAVRQTEGDQISWFDHDIQSNALVQNNKFGISSYIVSYASIISTSLFNRIIDDAGSERRWSKMTPFDFEKAPSDIHWLPLRRAIPKQELFASIDDDLDTPGSSLHGRGLYPVRQERASYANRRRHPVFQVAIEPLQRIKSLILMCAGLWHIPANYRRDYAISYIFRQRIQKRSLPWINYKAIDYLFSQLGRIDMVFEFGSGQSTRVWLNLGKKVVSVEHDPDFFKLLRTELGESSKLDYRLVEPEIDISSTPHDPANPEHFQSDDFRGYSFARYVQTIREFPNLWFDLVFIDGRARTSCIPESIAKLKQGGLLILDNSDRPHYLAHTAHYLAGWERLDFSGRVRGLITDEQTTVFIKPRAST